jgi:hypothetical protein
MSPSPLTNTPLAELADTRGWFAVSTPLEAGGTLRSVVYVDGDVTTKLIGARTLTAGDTTTHFAAIDQRAGLVRTRLRAFVVGLTALWTGFAAGLVVVLRDPAGVLGAVALLVPLGVLLVQRALRRTLAISAPTVAAIGAAVSIGADPGPRRPARPGLGGARTQPRARRRLRRRPSEAARDPPRQRQPEGVTRCGFVVWTVLCRLGRSPGRTW